ncbi:CapA family protein [Paenibacillus sp. BR2-3]|uniref:CapA family protein n=1 Tax=Paenibacillus sp. BR2-3 TaxID=3048494 RepID=UPI0039774217
MNALLLLMITALLFYYFIEGGNENSATPLPAAQSSISPSPEQNRSPNPSTAAFTTAPQTYVEPTPAVEPTPTVEPMPAAEPVPAESPTPAAGGEGLISGLPQDAVSEGNTVKLSFGGDVIFAGKVGELLKKKGYDYPYARLDGLLQQDDLTVINLETPVTEQGTGAANKQFVFKSPPEALDAMKEAGVDAVNLANNHTLDQGEQGLKDTLSNLDDRGIGHAGAGLTAESAYAAQYFERKGVTIALLGFTRVIPESSWQAGRNKPGLASVYDSKEGLKAIAEARKKANIVVVVVHWGIERVTQADAAQQSLGRSFIDAGADLVIGGHPHVLQGIEPYKGKWIAYSTGNFIFTKSTTPATWETAVVQAECSTQGQCQLQLKPFNAELGQPVPMSDADGQKLFKKVESLSWGRIKIGSDGKVIHSSE